MMNSVLHNTIEQDPINDYYTNERIIKGIRDKEDEIIKYIYETYYPVIKRLILKNKGNADDGKDIFQEALFIIYKKNKIEGLVLTCSFETYFYSICKRLWLKELRQRKYQNMIFYYNNEFPSSSVNEELERKKLELCEYHFNKLSKACQTILKLHFSGALLAEIMEKMEYNSKQHTSDRKYRCKRSLFYRIENDPKFKEIQDELHKRN